MTSKWLRITDLDPSPSRLRSLCNATAWRHSRAAPFRDPIARCYFHAMTDRLVEYVTIHRGLTRTNDAFELRSFSSLSCIACFQPKSRTEWKIIWSLRSNNGYNDAQIIGLTKHLYSNKPLGLGEGFAETRRSTGCLWRTLFQTYTRVVSASVHNNRMIMDMENIRRDFCWRSGKMACLQGNATPRMCTAFDDVSRSCKTCSLSLSLFVVCNNEDLWTSRRIALC